MNSPVLQAVEHPLGDLHRCASCVVVLCCCRSRSGDAEPVYIGPLELKAVAGTMSIGPQHTTGLGFEHPVEEHRLDPDVVVEVLEMTPSPNRGTHMCRDLRCAMS